MHDMHVPRVQEQITVWHTKQTEVTSTLQFQ